MMNSQKVTSKSFTCETQFESQWLEEGQWFGGLDLDLPGPCRPGHRGASLWLRKRHDVVIRSILKETSQGQLPIQRHDTI